MQYKLRLLNTIDYYAPRHQGLHSALQNIFVEPYKLLKGHFSNKNLAQRKCYRNSEWSCPTTAENDAQIFLQDVAKSALAYVP